MLGSIIILFILILLHAFFVACETSVQALNPTKVKQLSEEGNKKTAMILKIIKNQDAFLMTIKIFTTIFLLFSSTYAFSIFSGVMIKLLSVIGIGFSENIMNFIVVLGDALIVSFFVLVFAHYVPKKIGNAKSMEVAFFTCGPIYFLSKICSPFIKILCFTGNIILKLIHIDPDEKEMITEEEIRMMVDSREGEIDNNEIEMINNIFEFDDTTAGDIATHRKNLIALSITADYDEIINVVLNERHSRIPVYEDNFDNIIGILYIRDLMKYIIEKDGLRKLDLREILRKPYFVPFSKKTDELFSQMQKNKVHMAIVIDEYGGTVGIVTMEDLVEEVMGDILDEFDEDETPDIIALENNSYLVEGTCDLEVLEDYFDVELPTEEFDTLNGFLISQLGRIPSEGEKPEVEFMGLIFKVSEIEDKTIKKVIIVKI